MESDRIGELQREPDQDKAPDTIRRIMAKQILSCHTLHLEDLGNVNQASFAPPYPCKWPP
jgi:hypothetical protein